MKKLFLQRKIPFLKYVLAKCKTMNCSEVVVGNHKLHLFEINFDHSAQWILHFILSVLVCWKVKRQALRLYYLCLKFKFYCCVFSLLSQGCKTVEFEPIGIPLRWHEKKLFFCLCFFSLWYRAFRKKKIHDWDYLLHDCYF